MSEWDKTHERIERNVFYRFFVGNQTRITFARADDNLFENINDCVSFALIEESNKETVAEMIERNLWRVFVYSGCILLAVGEAEKPIAAIGGALIILGIFEVIHKWVVWMTDDT